MIYFPIHGNHLAKMGDLAWFITGGEIIQVKIQTFNAGWILANDSRGYSYTVSDQYRLYPSLEDALAVLKAEQELVDLQ